jgi:hypothetical protein
MNTNHKPATALPWEAIPYRYVLNSATRARIHAESNAPVIDDANPSLDDAAYIAHAANAYPELVAFVKRVSETEHDSGWDERLSAAALLAKLGEDA